MDASSCDPEYTICYGHVRELMTQFHFQILHYLLTHLWPQQCLPFSNPHTTPLAYTNVWPRTLRLQPSRIQRSTHSQHGHRQLYNSPWRPSPVNSSSASPRHRQCLYTTLRIQVSGRFPVVLVRGCEQRMLFVGGQRCGIGRSWVRRV